MKHLKILFGVALLATCAFTSCNRKEKIVSKFFDEQFPKYAGEAYLQQYQEEDIALLEQYMNAMVRRLSYSDRFEYYYCQQKVEYWSSNLNSFKECYSYVLPDCYREDRHKENITPSTIDPIAVVLFGDDVNALISENYMYGYAYSLALNTIKKVPTIVITEKKEINDSTWQVVTNGDKQFIVVFSNLASDDPSVEISINGKTIVKDLFLSGNVKDAGKLSEKKVSQLTFECYPLTTSLAETKNIMDKLGYVYVDKTFVEFEHNMWDAYIYNGKYGEYDNCEIQIECTPEDDSKIQGISITIPNCTDLEPLLDYISSSYGSYQKEKHDNVTCVSYSYLWKTSNGSIRLYAESTSIIIYYNFGN